ncbi:hypothetical protein K432DRAFT_179719 [Lepidopterella palustris CBS 459.81]|uniref:Uncharacterized protein n=1 Tax=Lepidopterella palustris CBS 459.81 TaxID=1314670 RepID=A0A8E2E0S5_9PEZI|nr:hypothetical protein K432DRAFT_179719 [Lepidopterella palustris CBS 459.81]
MASVPSTTHSEAHHLHRHYHLHHLPLPISLAFAPLSLSSPPASFSISLPTSSTSRCYFHPQLANPSSALHKPPPPITLYPLTHVTPPYPPIPSTRFTQLPLPRAQQHLPHSSILGKLEPVLLFHDPGLYQTPSKLVKEVDLFDRRFLGVLSWR